MSFKFVASVYERLLGIWVLCVSLFSSPPPLVLVRLVVPQRSNSFSRNRRLSKLRALTAATCAGLAFVREDSVVLQLAARIRRRHFGALPVPIPSSSDVLRIPCPSPPASPSPSSCSLFPSRLIARALYPFFRLPHTLIDPPSPPRVAFPTLLHVNLTVLHTPLWTVFTCRTSTSTSHPTAVSLHCLFLLFFVDVVHPSRPIAVHIVSSASSCSIMIPTTEVTCPAIDSTVQTVVSLGHFRASLTSAIPCPYLQPMRAFASIPYR
ncbi:hypothetical protein C8R45DRAFT_1103269 [Mycena sanguinolenta]|nr:hypothetical protein C8R45DRAFT_1103269 [Mycena sanguinolenta]